MIYLEVKLPDIPGSLIEMMKPISQNGGNIYGILHNHDKKINNMIPVTVWFDLKEESLDLSVDKIQKDLIKKNIEIINISIDSKKNKMTFILSGHVFDTDITDTLRRLDKKEIKVFELTAKFAGFDEISNVKISVEFPESMTKFELIHEIEKICKEKNLFLIRS